MSDDVTPPEGISLGDFKAGAIDVATWVWGTLEGAFNEKQSISQMIVDAVIGMIPVVGDVTAFRDLIAVVIGLVQDEDKRKDKMQWMLLVVFICALIPVFGGLIKGIGRLLVHAMGDVARVAEKSAQGARLLEAMRDMVAACNRVGAGNAEKWLKELKFAKYQDEIMTHIRGVLSRITSVLDAVTNKVGRLIPAPVMDGINAVRRGINTVERMIADRIPESIKELDKKLHEIQELIYSGGESTSRVTSHTAEAGAQNVSRADELIFVEGRGATRTKRGGFAQNPRRSDQLDGIYEKKPGFPDIMVNGKPIPGQNARDVPWLATYSGQIENRYLNDGEQIYRIFGPAGNTRGFDVKASQAAGSTEFKNSPGFWGLGKTPDSAESWRQGSAVLDEWNRNGYIIVGTVLPGTKVPAATGIIAEQVGKDIPTQYLRGGEHQAMITFDPEMMERLNAAGREVQLSKQPKTLVDAGISWEIRPTGWKDVNGTHGYWHIPSRTRVQTARFTTEEIASKRQKAAGSK